MPTAKPRKPTSKATPKAMVKPMATAAPAAPVDEPANLHNAGLKVTLPRLKVMEVFRASVTRHLAADDIYRQLARQDSDISLATIYRVLAQLEEVGLVARSSFGEGRAVYELNEGVHHDHLVCISCGRVDEFTDPVIEARQAAIAREHAYVLTDHRLSLFGLCPGCATRKPARR